MRKRTKLYLMRRDVNIAPKTLTLEEEVKWAIISAGSLVGDKPSTLPDDLDLANDLQFDARKYDLLCTYLQQIVHRHNPSAVLKCSDVADCETVGVAVKLVVTTINNL